MTLNLDRSKCNRLCIACLAIAQDFERESSDPDTSDDRREIAKSSAEMWYALRDEVRSKIDAWDEKHKKKD